MKLALSALKVLGDPEHVSLLDVGCGNGRLAAFFQSAGFKVSGVDISSAIIERNRAALPGIDFRHTTPDQPMDYPDGSFDAIFCSEVIEHTYDVELMFGEFARLLRPEGLLILTTPYHGLVKNIAIALFSFERHFDPTWQHIRFWTKKSLRRICDGCGLQPTLWQHVGRFWPVPKSFFVVCVRR